MQFRKRLPKLRGVASCLPHDGLQQRDWVVAVFASATGARIPMSVKIICVPPADIRMDARLLLPKVVVNVIAYVYAPVAWRDGLVGVPEQLPPSPLFDGLVDNFDIDVCAVTMRVGYTGARVFAGRGAILIRQQASQSSFDGILNFRLTPTSFSHTATRGNWPKHREIFQGVALFDNDATLPSTQEERLVCSVRRQMHRVNKYLKRGFRLVYL